MDIRTRNLLRLALGVIAFALAVIIVLPGRAQAWEVTSMFGSYQTVLVENQLERRDWNGQPIYQGCALRIRLRVWTNGRIIYDHIHGARGPDKQLRAVVIPPGGSYPLVLDNHMVAPGSGTVEIEVEGLKQEFAGSPPILCGRARTTRTLCPSCGGYGVDRWEVTSLRRPY